MQYIMQQYNTYPVSPATMADDGSCDFKHVIQQSFSVSLYAIELYGKFEIIRLKRNHLIDSFRI